MILQPSNLEVSATRRSRYLLADGNSMEWQKGANHVLALPTEEHHVADRVYEATDLWSGEPTASSSAWQELLVRRIEEADELRKLAESDSAKNRAMAEAALTELITVRAVKVANRDTRVFGWQLNEGTTRPHFRGERVALSGIGRRVARNADAGAHTGA